MVALHFDNTLGALFIGFSVSIVIYALFLIESLNYYCRYPSDKAVYKIIVALLLLLETVHQAFMGHSVYYYTVTNFLDILALIGKPVWSLVFQILLGAVVAFIVKFLFVLRVWRFSYGNMWLTSFLLLLSFGQLALAIVFTVKSYVLPALSDLVNLRTVGIIALVFGVANDIGIAISLCYYLQTMRVSYSQSDSLIRNLTLYAVNTGVLTSAMSFTTLIIYNFMPDNLIFVSCFFVLSKLYGVSFVAALNTRQITQGRCTDQEPNKISTFSKVAEPRNCSLHVSLEDLEAQKDFQDIQSHAAEEIGVSTPPSSSEHTERPPYAVGW